MIQTCPLCCNSDFIESLEVLLRDDDPLLHYETSNRSKEQRKTRTIYKCKGCHSWHSDLSYSPKTLSEFYQASDSASRWKTASLRKDKPINILKTLQKYVPRNASVLEIGSNTGELLEFLIEEKTINAYSNEISKASIEILEGKGIKNIDIQNHRSAQFDVIIFFDVIEHISDPITFFTKIKNLLKNEDSVVIFLTGNPNSWSAKMAAENWWYYFYSEHQVFLSRKWIMNNNMFRVILYKSVYNKVSYDHGFAKRLWTLLTRSIRPKGTYNGDPAPFPDHHLVVCKVR